LILLDIIVFLSFPRGENPPSAKGVQTMDIRLSQPSMYIPKSKVIGASLRALKLHAIFVPKQIIPKGGGAHGRVVRREPSKWSAHASENETSSRAGLDNLWINRYSAPAGGASDCEKPPPISRLKHPADPELPTPPAE
jgi:hypothetical protein